MTSTLKQINARVTDEQLAIIERVHKQLGLSKAEFIRRAIAQYVVLHGSDDWKVFYEMPAHGGHRKATESYHNIDERYGDCLPVTLADYQELNPDGNFEIRKDGIYEDDEMIAELSQENE